MHQVGRLRSVEAELEATPGVSVALGHGVEPVDHGHVVAVGVLSSSEGALVDVQFPNFEVACLGLGRRGGVDVVQGQLGVRYVSVADLTSGDRVRSQL